MNMRDVVVQVATRPDIRGVTGPGGVVFGTNRSAIRLQELGSDVIPAIEDVLLHDAPNWLASKDPHKAAMGLEDVVHEYVGLVHQHNWNNGRVFLLRLPDPVLELVIICFYAEYGPSKGEQRLHPIPEWLKETVKDIQNSR